MTDGNGHRPTDLEAMLEAITNPETEAPESDHVAKAIHVLADAVKGLTREQRATRRLLNEVIAHNVDRDRDLNRRLDGIMDLLKDALSK